MRFQHPREDLESNRCELFASTLGVEFARDKEKLKDSKFYLLATLTEDEKKDGKRSLVSQLTNEDQEDFRISGVQKKESDEIQYAWNLNISGSLKAVAADKSGTQAKSGSSQKKQQTVEKTNDTGTDEGQGEGLEVFYQCLKVKKVV